MNFKYIYIILTLHKCVWMDFWSWKQKTYALCYCNNIHCMADGCLFWDNRVVCFVGKINIDVDARDGCGDIDDGLHCIYVYCVCATSYSRAQI